MKRNRASELRAIAEGRLMLNVRNGVTVSRSMLAMIADELDAEHAAHAETKRERDEAIKAAGDQAILRGEAEGKLAASEMAGIVDGWKRRAEAYRNQRDEALKALEPFAKAADNFDGFKIVNDEEWFAYGGSQSAEKTTGAITVADLRTARRVREGGKKDG